MKVVILCGGMGTRMRNGQEVLPKPLVPVGPKPILWHIMRYYAHFGHRDFVLCLGYGREAFIDYFLNYRYRHSDLTLDLSRPDSLTLHDDTGRAEDWQVTLSDTGLHSQTGSRLLQVARYLPGERFLATYGDGLGTVDLDALLEFHVRERKLATVTAVHPTGRFGEIGLADGRVTSFAEKPQTTAGYINGGFFVFEREFLERYVDDEVNCVLEADALARCAKDGQLAAYCHEGFWQCMDTPREQQLLEELWHSGQAPWHVWMDERRTNEKRKTKSAKLRTKS